MEVPSLEAVELYNIATRLIALAGIYPVTDTDWALERLRREQSRYVRDERDWQAYENVINAIIAVALED